MYALRVDGVKRNLYIGNLGIVLDKEQGVFKSKERGIYSYTLDGGYTDAPARAEILPQR